MLELNEPKKLNWNIYYSCDGKCLIVGDEYDFIPVSGDCITVEGNRYIVRQRSFDFDAEMIMIDLLDLRKA